MTVADRYLDLLIERLAEVRATQAQAIDRAAEACAASIAADKLVFMFPRTGTIVGFRPIVERTMISYHRVWGDMGARQYRFIHAVEGYARGPAIASPRSGGLDRPFLPFRRQRRDP
jgi:hypothetical protein